MPPHGTRLPQKTRLCIINIQTSLIDTSFDTNKTKHLKTNEESLAERQGQQYKCAQKSWRKQAGRLCSIFGAEKSTPQQGIFVDNFFHLLLIHTLSATQTPSCQLQHCLSPCAGAHHTHALSDDITFRASCFDRIQRFVRVLASGEWTDFLNFSSSSAYNKLYRCGECSRLW